ncbi:MULTISPECIES: hypothetical protein [unclassified Streptomyces]|uniref:hypothetical protein n=1 Tax=unclassified Streptomyces TaxID=2593676 RepID=UPI00278C873D|nr:MULTISPECIES: hypothetical protein [unclassified Streptomyces]
MRIEPRPMNIDGWVRFQHSRRKVHIFVGALFVLGVVGIAQGFTPDAWWVLTGSVVAGVAFELFCRRVKARQPESFRR